MPDDIRYEQVVTDGRNHTRSAVTEHYRSISPGRIVGGIAGVVLATVGVIAIAKAGIDSSLDTPVVSVLGMDQSALVGLVEFGLGLLIVLGAASDATRTFMGAMGVVCLVAGVLGAAATASVRNDIGTGSGSGWFVAVIGAVVVAASFFGTYAHSRREVYNEAPTTHVQS